MLRSTLTAVSIALLAAGCSDINAPFDDASFARKNSSRTLTTSTSSTETSTAETSTTGDLPDKTVEQSITAPPLMTYSTSFVAIQGQTKMFNLYYKNPDTGGAADRFLYVEIPWDAQLLRTDGTPASLGEAVEITVDVDPQSFFVQFGPHGSTFLANKPAQLWFNYQHADLQGHKGDTPTIWYQPSEGETWEDQGTLVRQRGKWLYVEIEHFSNYAVAW